MRIAIVTVNLARTHLGNLLYAEEDEKEPAGGDWGNGFNSKSDSDAVAPDSEKPVHMDALAKNKMRSR